MIIHRQSFSSELSDVRSLFNEFLLHYDIEFGILCRVRKRGVIYNGPINTRDVYDVEESVVLTLNGVDCEIPVMYRFTIPDVSFIEDGYTYGLVKISKGILKFRPSRPTLNDYLRIHNATISQVERSFKRFIQSEHKDLRVLTKRPLSDIVYPKANSQKNLISTIISVNNDMNSTITGMQVKCTRMVNMLDIDTIKNEIVASNICSQENIDLLHPIINGNIVFFCR